MYLSAVSFLLKAKIMCICKHSMRWQNEVFIHNTRHEENRIQNNLLQYTVCLSNYFIIHKVKGGTYYFYNDSIETEKKIKHHNWRLSDKIVILPLFTW